MNKSDREKTAKALAACSTLIEVYAKAREIKANGPKDDENFIRMVNDEVVVARKNLVKNNSADQSKHAFRPLEKVLSSASVSQTGIKTSLGFQIVDVNGGTIRVKSGSVFVIE